MIKGDAEQPPETLLETDEARHHCEACSRLPTIHAHISKTCPYIGTFHYAPSAGNRSRQTYFERDIQSVEQLRKQHAIRINPNIGIFHYGDFVLGEGFTQFLRKLGSMKNAAATRPPPGQDLEITLSDSARTDRIRSGVQIPLLKSPSFVGPLEKPQDAVEQLRRDAYATVLYASGDNLVKLSEKQRRVGIGKRFRYNGAIDMSKMYPITGSVDDCALLKPVGAERSRLYNDLMGEVNGFRKYFVQGQSATNPKDAYKDAFRQAKMCGSPNKDDGPYELTYEPKTIAGGYVAGAGLGYGQFADFPPRQRNAPFSRPDEWKNGDAGETDELSIDTPLNSAPMTPYQPNKMDKRGVGFTTSQVAYSSRGQTALLPNSMGDTWFPGTMSAAIKKESWKNKQNMRDTTKFKPFFVQSKAQIDETYELYEDVVMGEGSYATVIQARHKATGELVAIKAVQKRLLFTDLEKSCVMHEVENQLRIIHGNIVRLYEVFETPDHLYLVLEHCPCGELEKMIYARGKLTEIEAKRVTKQLLKALAYLHGKGIVHCDVKPQNLLFKAGTAEDNAELPSPGQPPALETPESPAGLQAKLCDFGMSRKVPDVRFYKLTGDVNKIPFSALCGTGGFIAPEILRQQPFGKAADLWSVGVMLYQMISGRMPFMPARNCLDKPVVFGVGSWRMISDEAKNLITLLLEKDPSKRITADEALSHPWLESVQHLKSGFPHFVPTAATPIKNGTTPRLKRAASMPADLPIPPMSSI